MQFSNQPDTAYDLCHTIAPNCAGEGSFATASAANELSRNILVPLTASNIEQSNTDEETVYYPETSESTLDSDESGPRLYGHFGRNRIDDRNGSEDLWIGSVTTSRPTWQSANIYGITRQYPTSTDSGKHLKIFL